MNTIQSNYIIAKANHEAVKIAHDAYADSIEHLFDVDDMSAWDDAMESAPEYMPSLNALLAAEEALIDWAFEKAVAVAFLDQMSDIALVRERTSNLKIRKQIIEGALKLS